MTGRRKLGGIQTLGEHVEDLWYIGRQDEYTTVQEFMRAARKEADHQGYQDCMLAPAREVLLRVSPPFGGDYDYRIEQVDKQGPGVWRSWKTELTDDPRPRLDCCGAPLEWDDEGEPMKEHCEQCGCDVCPECDQYGNKEFDYGTLCKGCYEALKKEHPDEEDDEGVAT